MMKKNKLIKGILIVFLLFCFNSEIYSQCSFNKTEANGQITTILLPCDFPVINTAKATPQEKEIFAKEIIEWKIKNKGFDFLTFIPNTTNEYFEIDQVVFDSFSEEKKLIVNSMPFFYKIKTTSTLKPNKQ